MIIGFSRTFGGGGGGGEQRIWPSNPTPAVTNNFDTGHCYNLGVLFKATVGGSVTGAYIYLGTASTPDSVYIAVNDGTTILKSQTFSNSASGWQRFDFTTALTISANTRYQIYYSGTLSGGAAGYALTGAYFSSGAGGSGVANGNLYAYSNTEANGVSWGGGTLTGQGQFHDPGNGNTPAQTHIPIDSFNAGNYWIDPIFMP